MKTTLIARIARTIQARQSCITTNNIEWIDKHEDYLIRELQSKLPSGSGIDSGCKIDIEKSQVNRVVITFGYHFMNDNGYYDGWGDYKLIVTPEFDSINFKIIGSDRKGIKEYLYDLFDSVLTEIIEFPYVK